ncbi:MAG: hypothetical protein ACRDO0_16165 [Nocardioidaceae bacterium]
MASVPASDDEATNTRRRTGGRDMRTRTIIVAAALALAAGVGGSSIAAATGEGDDGEPIATGRRANAAVRVALEATHGGRANAVERDSENGATWEVEVTEVDGDTVDVRLDDNFDLIVIEGDTHDTESGNSEQAD